MAWTTPASYATNEVLASSKLNTHVRDNLRYLKGLDGGAEFEGTSWRITNNLPQFQLYDANGTANGRLWNQYVDAGTLVFASLNDASSAEGRWLAVTRSGTTISGAEFQANVPVTFGDALTLRTGSVNNFPGFWLATSGGTNRAAVGLDAAGVSPFRVFSSALGANVLAVDLNNGNVSLRGGAQLNTGSGLLTVAGTTGLTLGTLSSGDVQTTIHLGPNVDNALTCGVSGRRWSAVHAANGTIQTSSRDTKRLLGEVAPAAAMASLRGVPVYRYHYLGAGGEPQTEYTHTGPVAEEMPAGMLVAPGLVNGQDTSGYLMAALQDVDARLRALEAERSAA